MPGCCLGFQVVPWLPGCFLWYEVASLVTGTLPWLLDYCPHYRAVALITGLLPQLPRYCLAFPAVASVSRLLPCLATRCHVQAHVPVSWPLLILNLIPFDLPNWSCWLPSQQRAQRRRSTVERDPTTTSKIHLENAQEKKSARTNVKHQNVSSGVPTLSLSLPLSSLPGLHAEEAGDQWQHGHGHEAPESAD